MDIDYYVKASAATTAYGKELHEARPNYTLNDSIGITGLAPEAELIVIKCECDASGQFTKSSDLVFGLAYAIEAEADVVNMSFGTQFDYFSTYTKLAADSDIICVAAAGNDGTSMPTYPAADENVIGVGAFDTSD